MKFSGVLLVVWILLSSPPVQAESVPQKPEVPLFDKMVEWELHFSLGIVVLFQDGNRYAYPILAQYPVSECKEVQLVGDEVYLMVGNLRYVIKLAPMLFLKPQDDWVMYD
jgi:hypothetical protein